MSPLMFANWGEINRFFCVAMWVAAVALAVLVITHQASPARACPSKRAATGASTCTAGPAVVRAVR